jgi:hypothetical protein
LLPLSRLAPASFLSIGAARGPATSFQYLQSFYISFMRRRDPFKYNTAQRRAAMKIRKFKPERGGSLNQLLNRRLISYATAAAATGAGVLGLTQPAEAQIVYTPAHEMIGNHTIYSLDLTNHGATDFVLHGSLTANCSTVFSALLVKPALDNAVEGAIYLGVNAAKALNAGQRIGSSQLFVSQGRGGVLMGEAINSPGGGQYRGNWVHVFDRYLGLKFRINGDIHYGWARMSVRLALGKPLESVLTGYAYETQPNTPITAGQEQGQADGIPTEPWIKGESGSDSSLMAPEAPQPASLGILALGAEGLPLWRRGQPTAAR